MQAWQKRDIQRKELLGELKRELIQSPHGEYLGDSEIRSVTHLLLETVNEELNGVIETTNPDILVPLHRINGFARTTAEATVLKYELLQYLLGQCFLEAQRELLRQAVHEPKTLYAGRLAVDEVE